MSNQQRRFVTAQRNSQKDTHRASYQPLAQSSHTQSNMTPEIQRYGSSADLLAVPTSNRMKYSDIPRSPSASQVKSRQQVLKSNIVKRKNQRAVSNLKSELQNLKLQVSRIMNKDNDNIRGLNARGSGVFSTYQEFERIERLQLKDYGKEISDSVSITSEKVIDQPLRKLQLQFGSQNYDHAHYLDLENNLLKTQLRNLKNKYNATKQQLREKCQALEKKNDYLQVSLRKSQDSLRQCKRNLQVQIQTIKFQLNRKFQQQITQQRFKNHTVNAERDMEGGNQLIQQKLRNLYQQLNEKSKIINNMNLQFNELRGEVQKKSFELKKQIQRSRQLSIQLQFAKRQNSRNHNLLEHQVSKKIQLTKNIQDLRERVCQLTKQLQLKDKIVNNSEEFENKLSVQIQNYKQNQQRLSQQNFQFQNQLRKLRQFIRTNEQQIKQLKKTLNDFIHQIENLSRNVRLERERCMETQQSYRKMIDELKANGQRQLNQVQKQFQKFRLLNTETNFQKEEELKQRADTDIKQKDRQISKWKAQYKMLKIKFQEHATLQNSKKQEIETYYRNYKQYKTKNKVLQMKNKVLEDSANQYIKKIQNIQTANLEQRAHYLQTINNLNMDCQQLTRNCQSYQLQLNEIRQALNNEVQRANQQESYRKQIQHKFLTLNIENKEQIMLILEKIKKRVNEQDDKINKYVKQSKNKDALLNKLRQQIRNVMQSQQRQLQNFMAKQIGDVVHQIQSKTFVSFEQLKTLSKKQIQIQINSNNQLLNQNAKLKGQVAELTKQLMELRQQTKSISHLYNVKSLDLQQLTDKHKSEINNYQLMIQQLQKVKNSQIKNLQSELAAKNQQNQLQRNEIKMLTSISINLKKDTFDEALKNQIEASKKLREQINKKNEEVYRIRDAFTLLKAQYDNLKSESDIKKLKFISEKKNIQVQFQVQSQQIKSQLLVQQKKVVSLQQKIKLVIDENKKKDNFIQTYIMGKKLPTNQRQFMTAFLKQYQICVTGKNITQKLQTQSQQLEKLSLYNFNLMKQIAEMKQKQLLYEAISNENSQLSKSISQYESPTPKIVVNAKNSPSDKKQLVDEQQPIS